MQETIPYVNHQGRINLNKLKLQIDRRIVKIMKSYSKNSHSRSCLNYKSRNNSFLKTHYKPVGSKFQDVPLAASVTNPQQNINLVPFKDDEKQYSDSKSDFDRKELQDNLDAKFFTKSTFIFEELIHVAHRTSQIISDKDCQQTIDQSIGSYRIRQTKEFPSIVNAKRSAISYRGYEKVKLTGLHNSQMKKSICLSCSSKYDKKQSIGSRIQISERCKTFSRDQINRTISLERKQSQNNKIRTNLLKRLNQKILRIYY